MCQTLCQQGRRQACLPSPAYISGVVVSILFLHWPLLSALGLASCPACSGEKMGMGQRARCSLEVCPISQLYIFFIYYFIYLAVPGLSCSMQTRSCGMWDLVPRPGMEPVLPALGAWSLTHWTIREVAQPVINTPVTWEGRMDEAWSLHT